MARTPQKPPLITSLDGARRVLRGLFVENVAYKAVSLLLALGVWAWVQGEQVVEESAWVDVTYSLPEGVVFAQTPVQRIRVTASGAQAFVKDLKRRPLKMEVDLSELAVGPSAIDFVDGSIENLPGSVKVVGVVPASVNVQLEPKVIRTIELKAAVVGAPADGYRISEITLDPAKIQLEGPASALNELGDGVATEGIPVAGLQETTQLVVDVTLKSRTLARVDARPITAEVVVEPVTRTRSFELIPVLSLNKGWEPGIDVASVTLAGPVRLLDKLTADQVFLVVVVPEETAAEQITVGGDPSAAAHYKVNQPHGDQVQVLKVTPNRFVVEPKEVPE